MHKNSSRFFQASLAAVLLAICLGASIPRIEHWGFWGEASEAESIEAAIESGDLPDDPQFDGAGSGDFPPSGFWASHPAVFQHSFLFDIAESGAFCGPLRVAARCFEAVFFHIERPRLFILFCCLKSDILADQPKSA